MADSKDKSPWPFFAFGVGTVLAVGVIGALWFLFRRLSALSSSQVSAPGGLHGHLGGHLGGPPFGGGNGNYFAGPVHLFLGGSGSSSAPMNPVVLPPTAIVPASAVAMQPPTAREARATSMRTFTLSDSSSLRVFTATKDSGWRVEVRVVGPPGSFGIFSTNSVLLDTSTYTEAMIIPAGASHVIDLAPRDALYAKGVTNNANGAANCTTVSITANPTPIYG